MTSLDNPSGIQPHYRVAAANEPMAAGVIEFLGGPLGRHARIGRAQWWTPLRVLITVAWSVLGLAFLVKAHCAGGRVVDGVSQVNWEGNRQYTAFCYNDIIPLYAGRGLHEPGVVFTKTWLDGDITRYIEYPVLTSAFQWLMASLARVSYPGVRWTGLPEAGWYFALTALVLSCVWVVTIMLVYQLVGNRTWDTVLVAASPLVVMHAFTNWDILAVCCMVVALWLAARHRPGWAGAALGIGTAVKLWPLFILGAYLVLAVRHRSWLPVLKMASALGLTWLVINLPVLWWYPQAWGEFYRLNESRGWEWTTSYALASRIFGWNLSPELTNTLSLLGFILGCAAIAILGWKAPRAPRVAELVFLIIAAFLLVNKVWSPQYSLWLLVPAVLALPHWRVIYSWTTLEALLWPVLMWHMMGVGNKGAPAELLNLVIIARDAAIVLMVVMVIRQLLQRQEDKVAAAHPGLGDPLAGPFRPQRVEQKS